MEFLLKFIDLFAGIGGMRMAFEQAGHECVLTCEKDPLCHKTYRTNFGNEHIVEDIKQLSARPERIPDHDLLLAGFPCQPFSALGKQQGLECDKNGKFFYDIEQILAEKKPEMFLLENVRALTWHNKGKTLGAMLDILENKLGYHISTRVIDAKYWVPQRRQRLFIAGQRSSNLFNFDGLRFPTDPEPKLKDILQRHVNEKYTNSKNMENMIDTLNATYPLQNRNWRYETFGPEDVSTTVTTKGHDRFVAQQNAPARRFTPRENARLMGFPDDFEIPVPDTYAYKQLGNSVVVPQIKAIADLFTRTVEA